MPNQTIVKTTSAAKTLFSPGHRACAGCGQAIAVKTVTEALGTNIIIANATGCLEVTTTPYPESAWGVPWIHSLFENPAAIASGILAALKQKGQDKKVKVIAQGGDGSTFDIGFGLISGMWERGENILYICYDNEAYANTGVQASSATPLGASTTTTPIGKDKNFFGIRQRKKDMISIALAHNLPFVAQTTIGYLSDIHNKIKKALSTDGSSYIQILVSCVPGWGIKSDQAMQAAKLAAQTGLYPSLEYTNGVLTEKIKVPSPTPSVNEYLKMQGRFAHLFKLDTGEDIIAQIQKQADENIKRFGLK